jgi:hypothetical protein
VNSLDRVTEAARAITNLGLPDNCVYSERTKFEQEVIQEFIRACFDARRELQEVYDYETACEIGRPSLVIPVYLRKSDD